MGNARGRDEEASHAIVGAALRVHTALGPGLLESAYEACLAHALARVGLQVERQVEVPLVYEGADVGIAYRIDMLVDGCVIVEIKAVERVQPLHAAQLLSYLRLSGRRVGLLLNFNTVRMRDGIRRIVNG